jgi:RNA polymerase sigma-70 factor (ECF subfamily)
MLSPVMDLRELNDDDLIRETLDGNREAFGDLMRKYKDSLYDLAYRILGNFQEVEDILQDAFMEAFRHLKTFNHNARFSTWMYSIVLNRVRNRLRRNKTIRWQSLDAPLGPDPDGPPPEVADRGPSLPTLVEGKLHLEALEEAVQTLPLEHRSIFILHYMQNLPLQDVAIRLGRPVGTVKVYLHRARKRLYKYFLDKGQSL